MRNAAPSTAIYRTYDIDHSMRTPAALADRDRFLMRTLRLR
jgi:hypothetical protein